MTRKYIWVAFAIAAVVIVWKILANKSQVATVGMGQPSILSTSSVVSGVTAAVTAGLGFLNSRDSGQPVDDSNQDYSDPNASSTANAGLPINNV